MARKTRAKDPHAVALNRKRQASLSPARRAEIARAAAVARWRKSEKREP